MKVTDATHNDRVNARKGANSQHNLKTVTVRRFPGPAGLEGSTVDPGLADPADREGGAFQAKGDKVGRRERKQGVGAQSGKRARSRGGGQVGDRGPHSGLKPGTELH